MSDLLDMSNIMNKEIIVYYKMRFLMPVTNSNSKKEGSLESSIIVERTAGKKWSEVIMDGMSAKYNEFKKRHNKIGVEIIEMTITRTENLPI